MTFARPLVALLLALTSAALLPACVEDTGLIDRTQVNRLHKTEFAGVWYEFQIVSNMPSSAAFGFVGQSNFGGKQGKVLFDIQENFLVVYPYTEPVVGGDGQWNKRKIRKYWDESIRSRANREVLDSDFIEVVVGNPTAMYPIQSHFDVKRDYATSTGAQTNVLVENTTDRPWWQRDYIRVDWMGNTLSNFMFPQGSVAVSPVDYFVQDNDKDNPNQFYLDPDGGYFHWTRRLFGTPQSTGACSMYSLSPGDCAGAAFDVRVSYRRADAKRLNDYEIRPYHNAGPAQKFGYFLSDRYNFDENYGLSYSAHDYKAARWNIWQHSKDFVLPTDKNGQEVHTPCLTKDDCAAPSVCDQPDWFMPGECKVGRRLDYSERGIRPIVYHISAGTPADHLSAEYRTADGWSDVFAETVSWLLFWEDKWRADLPLGDDGKPKGRAGFTDPQSKFGQRFCTTNADCAQHATVTTDIHLVDDKFNGVVVAAGAPGQKAQAVVLSDRLSERPTIPGGAAWLTFVNATPGSAPATLTVGGTTVANVAFQAGEIAAAGQSVVLPAGDLSAKDATVTAGSATATLGNLGLKASEAYTLVYLGGDALVLLRASLNSAQLRAVNAVATTAAAGSPSTGADLQVGVSGALQAASLGYGQASAALFYSGQNPQVAFVRPGGRTDLTCMSSNGLGMCTGWKQDLGQSDYDKRAQIKAALPPVFVLCENRFAADKATCDAKGQTGKWDVDNDCRYWRQTPAGDWQNPCADVHQGGWVKHAAEPKIVGDSRYNFMYWVTNVEPASPLGYGPSAPDPDTGEIQWACANVYGAQVVTYSQYAKDLVDLLNGDLTDADLKTGKYIRAYLQNQARSGLDKSAFLGAAQPDGSWTTAEAEGFARERATLQMAAHAPAAGEFPQPSEQDQKMLREIATPLGLSKMLDEQGATFDLQQSLSRLSKVSGTAVERAMINDEVALSASGGAVQPGDQIAPEMMDTLSPLGWATPKQAMAENRRMQLLGIHTIEPAEFYDPAIVGLAQRLACKDGQDPQTTLPDPKLLDAPGNFSKVCYKGDALRTALSVAIFRSTLEHEVGHTVGLRHNFQGSADFLNYLDPYFDPDSGREREPTACADLLTPAGVVSANQFCGRDMYGRDLFGEKCVYPQCTGDDDCPRGTACVKNTKQCVDTDGVKVGMCQATLRERLACSDDAACSDNGDAICRGGKCESKVTCTADASCGTGNVCTSGFCVSARDGSASTTPLYLESTDIAYKYVPRAEMTQGEIDNRRMEYQYSSIMDYGQKIHSSVHGLGKYDYAAIRYGYGELVDVYADTSYLRDRVGQVAKRDNPNKPDLAKWSFLLETSGWQYDLFTPQMSILSDYMPPEYNRKRDAVPEILVNMEGNNVTKYGRSDVDRTFLEVPYKYCSDEFVGVLGCNRFDTGATPEEIVWHAGQAVEEYYLFDAFKRERQWFARDGSPLGYMARITDRWLTPLGTAGRYYALYNNILRFYPWFPMFDRQEAGFAELRRSSLAAFTRLAAIIGAPAPGAYVYDKKANLYVNTSTDADAPGEAHVPLGPGKYPWTSFAQDKGYYYADHPLWIGGYWDKVAAIQVMTNATVSLITESAGEQLPLFRGTAIGFNTIYPRELMKVLGGLVAGDASAVGGTFVNDSNSPDGKSFRPADPFRQVPTTTPRVQPSINNLTLRLQAAWQAVANLPAGFDPSYTDSMAVWLKGNGLQFQIGQTQVGGSDAPLQFVEFADPFGQKTYVAPKPNYDADRYSPTYRMLERLNTWKTGCPDGAACAGNLCSNGNACAASHLGNTTGAEQSAIAQAMKTEIEIVDYMRQLYAIYGAIGAGN